MKRKALAAIMAVAMAVSMAGCGGSTSESKDSTQKTETADSTASTGGSVENKDKPLCWFNRQPSSSATGELDKDALNFNGNTYYVGFDANQGAELQGQMVLDYIKKNADTIDRNGDGVIGYVLAIGDIGHNDSIARTRGVRSALGTGLAEPLIVKEICKVMGTCLSYFSPFVAFTYVMSIAKATKTSITPKKSATSFLLIRPLVFRLRNAPLRFLFFFCLLTFSPISHPEHPDTVSHSCFLNH